MWDVSGSIDWHIITVAMDCAGCGKHGKFGILRYAASLPVRRDRGSVTTSLLATRCERRVRRGGRSG